MQLDRFKELLANLIRRNEEFIGSNKQGSNIEELKYYENNLSTLLKVYRLLETYQNTDLPVQILQQRILREVPEFRFSSLTEYLKDIIEIEEKEIKKRAEQLNNKYQMLWELKTVIEGGNIHESDFYPKQENCKHLERLKVAVRFYIDDKSNTIKTLMEYPTIHEKL